MKYTPEQVKLWKVPHPKLDAAAPVMLEDETIAFDTLDKL